MIEYKYNHLVSCNSISVYKIKSIHSVQYGHIELLAVEIYYLSCTATLLIIKYIRNNSLKNI